jgi:hypothetical protein
MPLLILLQFNSLPWWAVKLLWLYLPTDERHLFNFTNCIIFFDCRNFGYFLSILVSFVSLCDTLLFYHTSVLQFGVGFRFVSRFIALEMKRS